MPKNHASARIQPDNQPSTSMTSLCSAHVYRGSVLFLSYHPSLLLLMLMIRRGIDHESLEEETLTNEKYHSIALTTMDDDIVTSDVLLEKINSIQKNDNPSVEEAQKRGREDAVVVYLKIDLTLKRWLIGLKNDGYPDRLLFFVVGEGVLQLFFRLYFHHCLPTIDAFKCLSHR